MTFKRFRSRKLLLLLAFFQLDFDPYESQSWLPLESFVEVESPVNSLFNISSSSPKAISSNETVWIVDEQANECLGPHGFSACGDLSGWVWIQENGRIKLKHAEGSTDNSCLGWKWTKKKFEVMSCDIAQAHLIHRRTRNVYWSYDPDLGQLQSPIGLLETLLPFSPYCVVNDNRKRLQRCNRGATRLKVVPLADISLLKDDLPNDGEEEQSDVNATSVTTENIADTQKSNNEYIFPDQGYWHCPITGLALPRNLDMYEMTPPVNQSEIGGRQVLMGAGVFTKVVFGMKFNVYNLGWYVDAAAAQNDQNLAPFIGKSFQELQTNQDFYNALIIPGGYDRTMYMKLAMNLKKDVVIQGIVEELPLQKKNAKILLDASNLYPHKECMEGLEILFKWRQPRESNQFQERLDIIIGDFVIPITEPGLAADFFYHYMRPDDPVSEEARLDFPRNFPLLLNGLPYKPSDGAMVDFIVDQNSQAIPTRFSFTKLAASYLGADHREVKRMRRWKTYMNSLLLKEHKRWKQDLMITVAVIIYSFVLIAMSLPPALIAKGVRVVNRFKRKSMRQLNAVIERTFSRSKSLATLARPASLAAMARSASSDFKVFFHNNFKNMQ